MPEGIWPTRDDDPVSMECQAREVAGSAILTSNVPGAVPLQGSNTLPTIRSQFETETCLCDMKLLTRPRRHGNGLSHFPQARENWAMRGRGSGRHCCRNRLEEEFGSSIWFNRRWSGRIGCFALCGAGGRPLPGRAVLGGSFGGGLETGAAETQGGHVSHGGSAGKRCRVR